MYIFISHKVSYAIILNLCWQPIVIVDKWYSLTHWLSLSLYLSLSLSISLSPFSPTLLSSPSPCPGAISLLQYVQPHKQLAHSVTHRHTHTHMLGGTTCSGTTVCTRISQQERERDENERHTSVNNNQVNHWITMGLIIIIIIAGIISCRKVNQPWVQGDW